MTRTAFVVLALAASSPACDTSVDTSGLADAAPVSPDCIEAEDHSDLPWLQEKIFTPGCANLAACHQGTAPSAAGVSLDDGMTQTSLVDVAASSAGLAGMGLTLVVPGDPDSSHLLVIMDHDSKGGRRSGALPTSGTMPFGVDLLCTEKLDAIERWIETLSP